MTVAETMEKVVAALRLRYQWKIVMSRHLHLPQKKTRRLRLRLLRCLTLKTLLLMEPLQSRKPVWVNPLEGRKKKKVRVSGLNDTVVIVCVS